MSKIIEHLEEEHRKVERLLAQLKENPFGPDADTTADEIRSALETHMAVEEGWIYPLIGDESATDGSETEHDLVRDALDVLDDLRGEPGFAAAVEMLRAGIAHHVADEEEEIFPELERSSASELERLDPQELERIVERRTEFDLSKAELYRAAQEAGIPGRSQMSREELIEALSKGE